MELPSRWRAPRDESMPGTTAFAGASDDTSLPKDPNTHLPVDEDTIYNNLSRNYGYENPLERVSSQLMASEPLHFLLNLWGGVCEEIDGLDSDNNPLSESYFDDQQHYDPHWEDRKKGVGFFEFSSAETDRRRQLDSLNSMRVQTDAARALSFSLHGRRMITRETRKARLLLRSRTLNVND